MVMAASWDGSLACVRAGWADGGARYRDVHGAGRWRRLCYGWASAGALYGEMCGLFPEYVGFISHRIHAYSCVFKIGVLHSIRIAWVRSIHSHSFACEFIAFRARRILQEHTFWCIHLRRIHLHSTHFPPLYIFSSMHIKCIQVSGIPTHS